MARYLDNIGTAHLVSKVKDELANKQDALSQTQLDNIANIDNKVTKTATTKQLYGTNDNGEQTTVPYGTDATQFSIVQRGGMGAIYVPTTPNLPNDATSKSYVDNNFAQKSKVLYDASSSSSALNWGYTNGIGNGVTVSNKDFTPYKYLICFCGNTDNHVGVIVNLINNFGGYGGRVIGNAWKENGLVIDIINISINSAKTSITPHFQQIWDSSDYTLNRGAIRTIVGVY